MKRLTSRRAAAGSPARNASILRRFVADDGGQDLVEYALLALFIAIAGWAIIMGLPAVMGTTYQSWMDPNNGVPSRWDPPEPASAGS